MLPICFREDELQSFISAAEERIEEPAAEKSNHHISEENTILQQLNPTTVSVGVSVAGLLLWLCGNEKSASSAQNTEQEESAFPKRSHEDDRNGRCSSADQSALASLQASYQDEPSEDESSECSGNGLQESQAKRSRSCAPEDRTSSQERGVKEILEFTREEFNRFFELVGRKFDAKGNIFAQNYKPFFCSHIPSFLNKCCFQNGEDDTLHHDLLRKALKTAAGNDIFGIRKSSSSALTARECEEIASDLEEKFEEGLSGHKFPVSFKDSKNLSFASANDTFGAAWRIHYVFDNTGNSWTIFQVHSDVCGKVVNKFVVTKKSYLKEENLLKLLATATSYPNFCSGLFFRIQNLLKSDDLTHKMKSKFCKKMFQKCQELSKKSGNQFATKQTGDKVEFISGEEELKTLEEIFALHQEEHQEKHQEKQPEGMRLRVLNDHAMTYSLDGSELSVLKVTTPDSADTTWIRFVEKKTCEAA